MNRVFQIDGHGLVRNIYSVDFLDPKLARSGCPVGSLCAELDKSGGDLARQASRPFSELLNWIEAQFATLGKGREKKALALHLLSALEGLAFSQFL